MATPSRKLGAAWSLAARQTLGTGPGPGGGALLPWDAVGEKLAELLRFLASAAQALATELREHAVSLAQAARAVALPAAVVVAVLLVLCGCCVAAGQRRRRRGPDWEEVDVEGSRDDDGPVVMYRGRCTGAGGIFSMHPNKPIVC